MKRCDFVTKVGSDRRLSILATGIFMVYTTYDQKNLPSISEVWKAKGGHNSLMEYFMAFLELRRYGYILYQFEIDRIKKYRINKRYYLNPSYLPKSKKYN